MHKHICTICSTPLTGQQKNACSRQCAIKVYTIKRRESGRLRGPKPRKYPFTCNVCNRDGMATKPNAKSHAYCQRVTSTNKIKLSSSTEIVYVPRVAPTPETTIIHGGFMWNGTCKICGKQFTSFHGNATCSDECQAKRPAHIRNKQRDGNHRKRARKFGVEYEPIKAQIVFQRDNYMCKLCGQRTEHNASSNADTRPSIDHIIALANGGSHTYDNVQTAHRICNSLKSDK